MLGGTYNHTVDDKGRVVIPAKFKRELGLEFIITAGYDKTLMIMSNAEWEKFMARFNSAPPSKVRDIKRFFVGNMSDATTDKQGRMQIPQLLRERLGIGDEVVLVGVGEMIEVWTPERWEARQPMLDCDTIAEAMDELIL